MKKDLMPMRQTKLKVPKDSYDDSEVLAVCLETNDRELLIPFKVYRVKWRDEYVCVIAKSVNPPFIRAVFSCPYNFYQKPYYIK